MDTHVIELFTTLVCWLAGLGIVLLGFTLYEKYQWRNHAGADD